MIGLGFSLKYYRGSCLGGQRKPLKPLVKGESFRAEILILGISRKKE